MLARPRETLHISLRDPIEIALYVAWFRVRAGALLVADDAVFINGREKLVSLMKRQAIPALYGRREFTAAGGLMSYGASIIDQYYQSGLYAGRILSLFLWRQSLPR